MPAMQEMAEHTLGHASKKPSTKGHKPLKEFHAKELHDGTYHVMMHHGRDQHGMEIKPPTEGSAPDIDGVHDHMHEHMGGPGDGEKGGEKKQGHEEAAEHEKEGAHSEEDEKSGDEETVEK